MIKYVYSNGLEIKKGDVVLVGLEGGVVVDVFLPNTDDAKDFCCSETGGVMLRFVSGDLQVWPYINEDLLFIRRGDEPTDEPMGSGR